MKNTLLILAASALALAGACSDSITDPNPPIITLSAQQATALATRAEAIADVHPDLEWLADSIEVVLRAGQPAKRIVIRENGEPVELYAVSLHREVRTSTSSFATWHLLAFDNASNPSVFVIANGFAQGTGTTPPTSVNGAFGGQSVFAHIIVMNGSSVDDRRATTGGATFAARSLGAACPVSGTPPAGVTCNIAETEVGFDVVNVTPPYTTARTYNLLAVSVPGVKLTIEQ
jgi:hypothetical protein